MAVTLEGKMDQHCREAGLELLQSQNLVQRTWSVVPYEQWADDLHNICGNFNPVTMERGDAVLGAARGIDVGGMNFAHVSNNLDRVHRSMDDIRRDANEHLFLIVQIEGMCGVEHFGRQSVLDVGDCILVDSTKPTTFHFGGRFSNHLSMHLPRQTMYSGAKVAFDIARKLDLGEDHGEMRADLIERFERGLGAVALDHAQIAFLEQHADQRALPHVILDDKGGRWLTHRNLHCYVECRETNAHAPRRFLRNRRRIWMEKACG